MSVTNEDDEQNQRLSRLEAGQASMGRSLGRSLDQVRDNFTRHEEGCDKHWKDQFEHNAKVDGHMRFTKWLGGAILTGLAGLLALFIEHFLGKL